MAVKPPHGTIIVIFLSFNIMLCGLQPRSHIRNIYIISGYIINASQSKFISVKKIFWFGVVVPIIQFSVLVEVCIEKGDMTHPASCLRGRSFSADSPARSLALTHCQSRQETPVLYQTAEEVCVRAPPPSRHVHNEYFKYFLLKEGMSMDTLYIHRPRW